MQLSNSPPSTSKVNNYETPQPSKLKAGDSFKNMSVGKSNLANAGMMHLMPSTPMAAP
jgi:hypothetical protein